MRCMSLTIALLLTLCSHAVAAKHPEPQTIYWEPAHLAATKLRAGNADRSLQKALANLRSSAELALEHGPYSVMQKKEIPPSGDKHDYLSFSRYWWPNPDTPDGLPYVRHDGKTNVEIRSKGDRDSLGKLFDSVECLALAYYYFENEKYAEHASLLISTWFLNPETKMNPHLNYAQAVPGRSEGRGVGIIDTRGVIFLLDAVTLLGESPSFSSTDQRGLQQWFQKYLVWLRTSELSKKELAAKNNHGSWYAAQVARIAIYVGDQDLARNLVETVRTTRIPDQFRADGSQPYEAERTKSLHYCFFNLSALSVVARVGEYLDIDLWRDHTGDSGSIESGLSYLRPYMSNQNLWPHQQLETFQLAPHSIELLRMASVRYDDPSYSTAIREVGHRHTERNYAPLVCAAISDHAKRKQQPVVTVLTDTEPTLQTYELPDISIYSTESIRKLLPAAREGLARVGPSAMETFFKEIFRKERGVDLQSRQQSSETRAIVVVGGALTLRQLVEQLDDESVASEHDAVVTLRLPILIQPSGTLIIDGNVTREVRLSTERGSLLGNAGTLFVLQAKVTSWNEQEGQSTSFVEEKSFRPFIASYIRSRTFLAGSTFQDLGYHAPTAYGLSLSSNPERNRGEASRENWPTGQIVGNTFRGLYYGFYSYEARDVAIVGNTYDDSIRYGIDPHDRSTRLIIANNTAKGTRKRHGIIGSRGVSNSFIFGNKSFDNHGSGIMLDRQCSGNVIARNHVFDNGQGIAIYESSGNLIAENIILSNKKSGIRIRNSSEIAVQENTVIGNGGYGFEVYSKRLDDHDKRTAHGDLYDQLVEVTIHNSIATGNQGGCIKGSQVHSLHLSNFRSDFDRTKIENICPQALFPLDVSEDQTFGSALKPFATKLMMVFDAENPVVEFK